MSLSFSKASNGDVTCFWNNQSLHSSYDPGKEAVRFVSNVHFTRNPSYILFLGPCLPYCVPALREKYPDSKLIAIQYFSGLPVMENSWDHEIILSSSTITGEKIYSIIGEELSVSTEVISWHATERFLPDSYITSQEAVKFFLNKSKSVLGTRLYFSKRWFSNTISFFSHLSSISLPERFTSSVLITASGPSLKETLPWINQNRSSFFLIALSSSLSVLADSSITPDLCLSTDGGYWAKTHLQTFLYHFKTVPLAISPESSIPRILLETGSILPLHYGDGPASLFYKYTSIPYFAALRNGTVSGTALYLARLLSSGPVLFAGLDLCYSKGFQHSQPNLIENSLSISDFRCHTKETRSFLSSIAGKDSLELYRNWFASLSDEEVQSVYRIKPDEMDLSAALGTITDISFSEAAEITASANGNKGKIGKIKLRSCRNSILELLNAYKTKVQKYDASSYEEFAADNEILELTKSLCFQKYLQMQKNNSEKQFSLLLDELITSLDTTISSVEKLQ